MRSVKKRGDGHRWATGEERREMIEAMAHDPGKASRARIGDHAAASAELLMRAGFEDEASLRLFECECGTGSMKIWGNMLLTWFESRMGDGGTKRSPYKNRR